jgi:hypothetical protein
MLRGTTGVSSLAWIGAGLLWLLRSISSHRAFAKGLLIALWSSFGLWLCSHLSMLYAQALSE